MVTLLSPWRGPPALGELLKGQHLLSFITWKQLLMSVVVGPEGTSSTRITISITPAGLEVYRLWLSWVRLTQQEARRELEVVTNKLNKAVYKAKLC